MNMPARPTITLLGDAEQALRRLGDWQTIDAQASHWQAC